ncbi:MAG: MazG nucleotide pyrophosphohydrolase domain-containing protein [Pseudomonadota bacterium]|jgi:uncharacterized protein YabN with tetrapyrrole methylase and pyrophosphatase domain|nr:hypothetical protein [Alphaproteobacteria bacterium]
MNSIEKIVEDYKTSEAMGFYWSDASEVIRQIRLELDEVEKELQENNTRALQEELGDVVHAWATLAYFCGFDANEIIEKAGEKFEKRFKALCDVIKEEEMHHFKSLTRREKLAFWEKAKRKMT